MDFEMFSTSSKSVIVINITSVSTVPISNGYMYDLLVIVISK